MAAQDELESKRTLATEMMAPKSITLNDLHGRKSKASMGQDLNVVLSLGHTASNHPDD